MILLIFRRFLPVLLVLFAGPLPKAAESQTGIISTIAGLTPVGGTPVRGYSGDGGPAASALLALANLQTLCNPLQKQHGLFAFDEITHLSVDHSGNIYVTDSSNQRIRRITPQGIITTVAGSGVPAPSDSLCQAIGNSAGIGDGGPAISAELYYPSAAIAHPNGSLIVADQQNNRIRQVTPGGTITTIVGSGLHAFFAPGVPATSSPLDWPSTVALDSGGTLYFAEMHSNRVARIAPDGTIITVAGTGFPGYNGDNQPATSAQLFGPAGITLDQAGNLYIADQANHRIRKVRPDGTIFTIAGTGQPDFSGDGGLAVNAALNYPNDVAVDAKGNIYIADMGNNRIRRLDPSGAISTVAGDGAQGRGPDGVPATSSSLFLPASVAVDAAGDLYILDWQNYLVRKVSFNAKPAISAGGIVNGASFAAAPAPVAPGSIISIFGVTLAFSNAYASTLPLPTQLAGTTVTVNGNPIPLFFVSPTQINAQLPFEVAPGTASAVVTNVAGSSNSVTFNVAASAVGIFQFPGASRAVALNQGGAVNGPTNPEARGRVIVAFLTGQGPVSPAVPTGQAASFSTLSPAILPVSATVGGLAANVEFLGLAPGFVGLSQANIRIPAGVTPGSQVVMSISVNGQADAANISVK